MKKFLLSLAAVALTGSAWADTYKLVSSIDEIGESADCLIVNTENNKAMSTTQNTNNRGAFNVTITNDEITPDENVAVVKITKVAKDNGTEYSFYVTNGESESIGYLYAAGGTGKNNYLKTEATNSATATITIDTNKNAKITFTNGAARNVLMYNATSSLFSCYASGQKDVQLYIKSATDSRLNANLSFPGTEYTANLGESFTAPELTKATTADVTYTSSNPEVATVDAATGAVTLVAAGTTTITATCEENDEYKAGKAEYTLTIVDPNAIIDTLNPDTLKPGSYTASESYTSTITNIEYRSQTYANKGYQFNTGKTGCGIAVTDNSQGYTISKITIVPSASNTDKQANNGVLIYAGNDKYTTGSTIGTQIAHPTGKEEIVITPETDYTYFSIVPTGGVYIISEIKIEWKAPAPIEKTDFAWDGISSNSDDVIIEDYDIWMPENMDATVSVILPTGFKGDSDKFNWILAWNEESSNPLSYNIENGNMLLKSTEAGIFGYSLSIKGSEYFNDSNAFDGEKKIYVYPDAREHFNIYDNEDAADHIEADGKFRLLYEDLNSEGIYKYHYFFEPKTSVAEAPRKVIAEDHSKYTEYNHEDGIGFDSKEGTLNLIVEKNGVKSAKPYQLKVGPNESTGVEAIGAEVGEAVYFDLQGRRVNGQPEQGLYIVRKGGKTSKVVL